MADLIYCAADWRFKENELRAVGERVIDTERLFNVRQGMKKHHDTLPKRYFDDPSVLKTAKGHHIDRKKFAGMLDKYYKLRGWDKSGMLSSKRVRELEAIA